MSPLSIVSTKSTDTLLNNNQEVIKKAPGGPLHFIENVLKEQDIPYKSFFRNNMKVTILITDRGEFGKIDQNYIQRTFPFSEVTENVIVSTILDEWNISALKYYRGNVFLDVQGYVREGKHFGQKKLWNESKLIIDFVTCLKATREEMTFLPPTVLELQKKRILLITDGSNAIEVWYKNKKTTFPVKPKVNTEHTIGAGDTFFAYFVSRYIASSNVEISIRHAITETNKFLKNIY